MSLTQRASSTTRGFGRHPAFDESKHPRNHGKFASKGGSTSRDNSTPKEVSRLEYRKIARLAGLLDKEHKASVEIQRERAEVLSRLSNSQRTRLGAVLEHKVSAKESKISPTSKPKIAKNSYEPKTRKTRTPTDSTAVKVSHKVDLKFDENGVTATATHHPSFKVENSKYEYKVTHTDGTQHVLNNHGLHIHYDGEVVRGVPHLIDVEKASNEELIQNLKRSVDATKKGNAPSYDTVNYATDTTTSKHLVSSEENGGYGDLQIHHINQWVADPAGNIEADFKAGKINQAERERRHFSQIEPDPDKEGGYQLKLAPKGQREFVVLPAGLHDIFSGLYEANHPRFLHPDTGKLAKIGIPKKGDSGRDWFSGKFRNKFYQEYYKHEAQHVAGALNKRVKSGKLDAKTLEDSYLKL